jgi:branched-chain amino acid transport system substrate-binding protein
MRPAGRTGAGRLVISLACAGVLLGAAACGARWDDEQRAAVLARADGSAVGPGGGDGRASGPSVTSLNSGSPGDRETPGGTRGPTAGSASGSAGGGDTNSGDAAGGGDGRSGPSGPGPCSATSDAPGVTDSQITLGTISTQSGAVPGLGASSVAAVQAYVAYRNATGGVCGRQLGLRTADDGMDNGRHRALTAELSDEVLGLVGGVGGGDAGSADVVEAEQLPVVNTPISDEFQNASTVFDINPPFADVRLATGKYRWLYDRGVRKAALVYIAADQTRSEAAGKHKPQMEGAGIRIVHQEELPLSTLSYDSAARGVANSGADYLLFVSEAGGSASMAKSMRDTGYELKFEEYLIAYGSNFIELAGDAAEGTSSWIRSLPNEDPPGVAEQANFLDWMDRAAPGVPKDTFAADAWAAAKAFVDVLESLPGPITRDAVLAGLRAVRTYDADGFIGEIQLGPKLNNGCAIAMIVKNGVWERLHPAQGFLC